MIRRVLPGDRGDVDWIRDCAAEAYAALGDYRTIIPAWLGYPGVLAYLDEDAGVRRGFIMTGFAEPPDLPAGATMVDLLAIAVAPEHRGGGLGRTMLRFAIDLAESAAETLHVVEMRLTVAEPNARARKLFESEGFRVAEADHGRYDGGQVAIRMVRAVGRGGASV